MPDQSWYEIRCHHCGSLETVPFSELVDAVRSLGHLRKSAEPSADLVLELLGDGLLPIPCSQCGASQTKLSVDDDSAEWAVEKKCQACAQPIDPERLEVFPDSIYCTKCQAKADRGQLAEQLGYCEHCGGLLASQQASGSGIARYVLTCSSCGRKQ